MAIVYLNLGSNLGDRKAIIEAAISRIGEIFHPYCLSGFVESEPWGYDSSNPFLNIGMAFDCDLHPEKLLEILKLIEKSLSDVAHRDSEGRYADREIDIDIMAIENLNYVSPTLQIPHKHLKDREFFMIPLLELRVEQAIKNSI